MNILFVHSVYSFHSIVESVTSPIGIQLGISYISSLLKKHGHHTDLIVISRFFGRKNKNIIDEYLKKIRPKLICFTAVATEYRFIADIAKYIKSHYKDVYLLIGGPHASLNPEEVLSDDFDALCIGEGEYPALELVSQLEEGKRPSDISNLWIKDSSGVQKNSSRPFLQDIDNLPFPDREMWQKWIKKGSESMSVVLLGRGCPFRCSYCSNHILRTVAPGAYVRQRSPDNIIEEIKEVTANCPALKHIFLEVETICTKKEWAITLCSKLRRFNMGRSKPLFFGTNMRITPNADLEDIFKAFNQANVTYVNIGLESGSERVRREILKRNYSNQDVINAVASARKNGLKINFYNMIGIPGETINDSKETIKINRICLPDKPVTSIFYPYPNTELHSLCKQQGLLDKTYDKVRERMQTVLDLPGFPRKQIQNSFIWFDYNVFKGIRPKYKLLIQVFRLKLASICYLDYLYRRLRCVLFR